MALHYSLGITLSHLDRPSETAEQFQWIVERGHAGREEVASARQWLDGLATAHEAGSDAGDSTAVIEPGAVGSMKGKTVWPGITPETRPTTLELKLIGTEPATEGKTRLVRVRLGAPYRLSKIPAGAYRVLGRTDVRELWNTRMVITAGDETLLDLTPENSTVTPDQFPPRNG